MSIEQEKEKILKSIDCQIDSALRDGKTHRIEIQMFDDTRSQDITPDGKTSKMEIKIKHSKLSYIKTFDTGERLKNLLQGKTI